MKVKVTKKCYGLEFQKLLRQYSMVCSMSRKAECWDNTQRQHSTIGHVSPAEFEKRVCVV